MSTIFYMNFKNKMGPLIFCVFAVVTCLIAKGDDSNTIRRIVIVGNEKTKDLIIKREMTTKIGEKLDEKNLDVDKNRILNLNLFTRVEFQKMQTEDGIVLLVVVAERWYIFPFPILFINERDWDKLSYGAGLMHQNFRGSNVKVDGTFWLGFNPGVTIRYSNPWIGGQKRLYTKFQAFSNKIQSKSLKYAERFQQTVEGTSLTFGKKWGYKTFLSMSAGYSRLTVPQEYKQITFSNTSTDHLPSLGINFRYDARDLYYYPSKGIRFDLYGTQTGFTETINYNNYGVDFRFYVPIYKKIIFAGRGATDLSYGAVPDYSKNYLGYDERIRGNFNTRKEGDNRAILGAEFRFPILPVRYISMGQAAAPFGAYGNDLPFGLSGEIFYDAGATFNQKQQLRQYNFMRGFGFGLLFHMPYVHILRLEYAFDKDKNSEIIFDAGVYF